MRGDCWKGCQEKVFVSCILKEESKSWVSRGLWPVLIIQMLGNCVLMGTCFAYLLGTPGALADLLAILEVLQDLLDSGLFLLPLLHLKRLTALAGLLLLVLEGLLDELDILETKLLADDVEITSGVDITLNVDNLGIIESTDDLEDGIDGADVGQESVAETSTSGGTTGMTGNIVDGQVGRDARLGVVLLAQPVEALIGDDDASLLGVDGGIGEVLREGGMDVLVSRYYRHRHRRRRRSLMEEEGGEVAYGRVTEVALGDGLEERGLANVCQSNLELRVENSVSGA